MSTFISDVEFDAGTGHVDLSERGERREGAGYKTMEFIHRPGEVSLRAHWTDEDVDGNDYGRRGVAVELGIFHATNVETDRTFHAHLSRFMTADEVVVLHNWLGFMLENWDK